MSRGTIIAVVLAATTACVPPKPEQLAPRSIEVTRAPAEVVQAAARALALDGFDITVSDAAGGIVSAKRVRARKGNAGFVACRYASGSIGETNMETTLTVTVTVRGNAVQVTNGVRVTMPGLTGAMTMTPSDDDCASTGLAETHVTAALRS